MSQVIFDASNFNKSFFELWAAKNRVVINYGGAGSGKSVATAQKILRRILTEENHRFLCVRKVNRTIKESVFRVFVSLINKWGLSDEFDINNTHQTITFKQNGNQILTTGLDDVEKLKSIVDITGIWIEEATELEEDDFTQLNLRLRGQSKYYLQIILTFNPVDETHWIVRKFFTNKQVDYDLKLIKTTFLDNKFIDEAYRKTLMELIHTDKNMFNIYALGLWGTTPVINAFLTAYRPDKHESEEAVYNPLLRVYTILDFNINPFAVNFAHIWEDKEGRHCHIFAEADITAGSIPVMADYLLSKQRDWPGYLTNSFFSGDASANKSDLSQRDNASYWRQLKEQVGLGMGQLKLPKINPTHKQSRKDCNFVLTYYNDFKINPVTCPNTVRDCRNVECAPDGSIIKSNRKDINQQADHLDCVRYLINTFLYDWIVRNEGKRFKKIDEQELSATRALSIQKLKDPV